MAVYRILENLAARLLYKLAGKMPKCQGCKVPMEKDGEPPLFLLPVFHDHTYTPSPRYYEENCQPIQSMGQIPTGQRACRFWTLTCPRCGRNKIMVEDFLKVRDTEVVEQRSLYDMDELDLMKMLRG